MLPARFSPSFDTDLASDSSLTGLLSHLDTIYGFALSLAGNPERAVALTEQVFASVHDDLWSTLGGRSLGDRLLARCVSAFVETLDVVPVGQPSPASHGDDLRTPLLALPWQQRAAVTLIDQVGLTYAAGATVLGVAVTEFRALLHRGRAVLLASYRAGAR